MVAVKKDNTPCILACDPSFTAWGWAVVDCFDVVRDSGVIRTEARAKKLNIRQGDDRIRRVNEILGVLGNITEEYNIHAIVSELPHGSQNSKAAVMIGVVAGLLQSMSYFLNIPIEWYSERDAKLCVLNKSKADKSEMVEAISKLYDDWMLDNPKNTKFISNKNEAVADSLAIFEVAKMQSPTIQYWKRNFTNAEESKDTELPKS